MARIFAFGKDLWDPSHRFETSWLLSPWLLFVLRALFSLYAFTTLIFILAWSCTHSDVGGCKNSQDEFSYFTVLTFWGIAFYFLFAALHTATYASSSRPLLERLPRPLQALHSLLYTTIVTYPFIVTAVYWALLYDGTWFATPFSAWSNISRHALNSFFALFELTVPRTSRPPWIHLPFLVVVLALYLALAYVTRATKGFYVYGFLNPGKSGSGMVAAYVFGILAGCVVVFLLVEGFVALRLWVTERVLGMDGRFAHKGNWRAEDQEMTAVKSSRSGS